MELNSAIITILFRAQFTYEWNMRIIFDKIHTFETMRFYKPSI